MKEETQQKIKSILESFVDPQVLYNETNLPAVLGFLLFL